ncbi:MAG TPA: MarC family protein [Steroidobacteraceae bacterium]|nr:MarC family protein [Steroidobacteraceae bacterium]
MKFFVVFFVVVEPISLVPLLSGLTHGATREYQHRMAIKAVGVAALILVLFALGGAPFLAVILVKPG